MAIKLTEENEDRSLKIDECVYARPYKIKEIKDHSNYPGKESHNAIGAKGFEPELCLEVIVEDEKFQRDKSIFLFGKYLRDKVSKRIKGWDTFNNNVNRFLVRLSDGGMEINDDYSIPDFLLHHFIGKEILITSYLSKDKTYISKEDGSVKHSWQVWGRVHKPETDIESIKLEWTSNVQYIKDYDHQFAVEYMKEKEKSKEDIGNEVDNSSVDDDIPF